MKKAALPINYVVALVLGIVVVGTLAYLFLIQSRKGISAGLITECESKQRAFCQLWNATNWAIKPLEPDWGNCTKINTENDCKKLLGYG